jgi:hypothetical protein
MEDKDAEMERRLSALRGWHWKECSGLHMVDAMAGRYVV